MDISNLYPNLLRLTDRRNQNSPVENDQRSGLDRRVNNNPVLPLIQNQRTFTPYTDPKLNQDLKDIKTLLSTIDRYDKASKTKEAEKDAACGLLCSIPYFRRAEGVYEAGKDHDTTKMLGGIGLFAINFPADTLDIKAAHKQIMGKTVSQIPHGYQEGFSFFRGTLLEPLLKKLMESKNTTLSSLGDNIFYYDRTLFNTKYSWTILKKLGCTDLDIKEIPNKLDASGCEVLAYKLEGKPLAKLVGRAMLRIPLLSVAALALMTLPSIIKAFTNKGTLKDNAVNGTKETVKSGVSVTSFTAGAATLGAALTELGLGPVGSLIGIGIGSYLGSKTGSIINTKIDNI